MKSKNIIEWALLKASVFSFVLFCLKLLGFILSGSLLLLGTAFDSLSDSIISFSNSKLHQVAKSDADREHPFGHGGIEVFAGFFQGLVLFGFATSIMVESVLRMYRGAHADEVHPEHLALAFYILCFSSVSAFFLQFFLGRKNQEVEDKQQRSLVLKADKAHYSGDMIVNGLSAVGVAIIWATGKTSLDALFGFLSGCGLLYAALPILVQVFKEILHTQVDPKLQQSIVDMAYKADSRIVGVHRLRTRTFGPTVFADFHMKLSASTTLDVAHEVGEKVVELIQANISDIDVIIHLDPDTEPDDELWTPSYKKS